MNSPDPGGPPHPPSWPPPPGPPTGPWDGPPSGPPAQWPTSPGPDPYGGDPYGGDPYGGDPYGGQPYGGQPYGGQPYGGGPYGGEPYGGGWAPPPPPGAPPTPGGPPAPRRRGGLVVALAGAAVVLLLVAVAAAVAVTRDDGGPGHFGAGPIGDPEEQWTVDLDQADTMSLVSDGERVYIVRETEVEDGDELEITTVVTAYAAGDGEELWDHEVHGTFSAETVRPLGDDEILVAEWSEDTTALVDGGTGEVLWEADGEPVESDISIGLPVPFGPGGSPDVVLLADTADGDQRVVAVARDDGEELWDVAGPDDALLCDDVVVTLTQDEPDEDEPEVTAPQSEITGRDAASGDELWTVRGVPGLCDEHAMAVADDEGVRLVELASGDEGETFDVSGSGTLFGVPAGDRLVVSWFDWTGDEPEAGVVVHRRGGGDPVFEEEDAFGLPVTEDLVLVTEDEGEDVRLVRTSDGEEIGRQELPSSGDGSCAGTLTPDTALFCAEGSPEVTAYAVADGFEERWTVDVGTDVAEATVGGDRLFVVTDEDELVALR